MNKNPERAKEVYPTYEAHVLKREITHQNNKGEEFKSEFLRNLLKENNLDTETKPIAEVDYLDTRENEAFLSNMQNQNIFLNFKMAKQP
jgi:hypothetical protein